VIQLKVKVILLLIFVISAFSTKIGSYFPDSLNNMLYKVIKKKIPDVSIEKITPGTLWKYDAVLSPFQQKGFKRKESLLQMYPVVFKSPRSDKVVFPLKYAMIASILGATLKNLEYDVTYVQFSEESASLLSYLRDSYNKGKIIPLTFDDLEKSVRYAVRKGYSVVTPQFLRWMIPKSYEEIDCKEFFNLSKPCKYIWVNLYTNDDFIANKVLAALMESKDELKRYGFLQDFQESSMPVCRKSCKDHLNSLMFLTFFTNKDTKFIVKDFEKATNRIIWSSRFFEKYYFITYFLIGFFVVFTLDYKMINYVRYLKLGGRQRESLYIVASILIIISFFGTLPDIAPTLSKVLFLPIILSITILDFISNNKKWWLPMFINTGILITGILSDRIFSVVDVPFLLATLSFINERNSFRWIFPLTGIFFYAAAMRAGHNIYIIPSLILSLLLFGHFVKSFLESKKKSWSSTQIDRPMIMFKLMHPILFTIEFLLIFVIFAEAFIWTESNIEKTMYLERNLSLALSNDFQKIAFPSAEISLINDRLVVRTNDPTLEEVRAIDRGILISRGANAYFSYVPYKEVVRLSLKNSSGYLIIMFTILLTNLATYAILGRYAISSKRDVSSALMKKDREYDETLKRFRDSLKIKEESLKTTLRIIDIFDPNSEIIDVLQSIAFHISELEFIERVWVAVLTEDGWISTDGERITVPIPDLKVDPENRVAVSLKHNGNVYALVSKIREGADYDINLFKTLKATLEKFSKFLEGSKK